MTASLDEIVPLYLKACEVEGKTYRTVQAYAETLRFFRQAVTAVPLPDAVEAFLPAHVYLFMGWVKDRGVSASTQHRRQREMKAFFSWCRRLGYVAENPFMRCRWCDASRKYCSPLVRKRSAVFSRFATRTATSAAACGR